MNKKYMKTIQSELAKAGAKLVGKPEQQGNGHYTLVVVTKQGVTGKVVGVSSTPRDEKNHAEKVRQAVNNKMSASNTTVAM